MSIRPGVANFVQYEEMGGHVFLELAFDPSSFLGGAQVVADGDGIGKKNGVSLLAGV